MEKKWDTTVPADLKKTICKWDIYDPLVTKGFENVSTFGRCNFSVSMISLTERLYVANVLKFLSH